MAVVVCGAVALYLLGRHLADSYAEQFHLHVNAVAEPTLNRMILAATAFYIILISIPFMPGIEVGLTMLMVFGAKVALLVYISTVTALVMAYLAGRLLPATVAARACGAVGLAKARRFIERLAPLSGEERMQWLIRESPVRLMPGIVRYRYLVLAVLFNVPGNMVIGGGGGIALLAGMTRLFPLPAYLLTVALAVAPVPLIVHLTDWL